MRNARAKKCTPGSFHKHQFLIRSASLGGGWHGAAVTDEGKRRFLMPLTVGIERQTLPSSELALLAHLPPREGIFTNL